MVRLMDAFEFGYGSDKNFVNLFLLFTLVMSSLHLSLLHMSNYNNKLVITQITTPSIPPAKNNA
jgi:hypothetical protein